MKTVPNVFLSYAREDQDRVHNLYEKLSGDGVKPWMDKRDILPGEKWEESIQNAIRQSDFVLICLSKKSINKRGFLQKEIRMALDMWQGMLESDIYLIPVRLEICDSPKVLSDFQWVDVFEQDGYFRLIEAIRVGIDRRSPDSIFQESPSHIETGVLETLLEDYKADLTARERIPQSEASDIDTPKLMIFVDGPNLLNRIRDYRRRQNSEFQIDPHRLKEFLVKGYGLVSKIRFYDEQPNMKLCTPNGYLERNRFISGFKSHADYEVRLHKGHVYKSKIGELKKGRNLDMSLALDMIALAEQYDVAMLVTSDSDFSEAVSKLYEMYPTKQIINVVLFWKKRSSQLLNACRKPGTRYFINLDAEIDQINAKLEV